MDPSPADVETDLVDLSEVSLSTLHRAGGEALTASLARLHQQVDKPRANLGGSTPPAERID